MGTLRIVGFGLLGSAAVISLAAIHVWHEGAQKKKALNALRELTPERLIANCGQPSSDSEPSLMRLQVAPNANTETPTHTAEKSVSLNRLIEYKGRNAPFWVQLEFTREIDSRWQYTQWHFTHFASPIVGVNSSDENAYIAVPVFPCIAKNVSSLHL